MVDFRLELRRVSRVIPPASHFGLITRPLMKPRPTPPNRDPSLTASPPFAEIFLDRVPAESRSIPSPRRTLLIVVRDEKTPYPPVGQGGWPIAPVDTSPADALVADESFPKNSVRRPAVDSGGGPTILARTRFPDRFEAREEPRDTRRRVPRVTRPKAAHPIVPDPSPVPGLVGKHSTAVVLPLRFSVVADLPVPFPIGSRGRGNWPEHTLSGRSLDRTDARGR